MKNGKVKFFNESKVLDLSKKKALKKNILFMLQVSLIKSVKAMMLHSTCRKEKKD